MKALRIGLLTLGAIFALSLLTLGYLASFGVMIAPDAYLNGCLAMMLLVSTFITVLPGVLLSLD